MSTRVTNAAIVSDIGIAHQIPSTPNHNGSVMSNGSRNSICRDSDRNMLIFALPMLWKKLVITIWNPTIGNVTIIMRMADADMPISVASDVNRRAHNVGTNSATRKPVVVTTVAAIIEYFSTCISRSMRCAPKL